MSAGKKEKAGDVKELIARLPIQVRSLFSCIAVSFGLCYGIIKAYDIAFSGAPAGGVRLSGTQFSYFVFAMPILTLFLYFAYDLFVRKDQKTRDDDDYMDRSVYVVKREKKLFSELFKSPHSVVQTARRTLCVTGSRSRDEAYLRAIESQISSNEDLVYTRVLIGAPTKELKEHLSRLKDIASKQDKHQGSGRIHVSELPLGEEISERFIVASETRALVAIPSFSSPQGYDTALIIEDDKVSQQLCSIVTAMAENAPTRHIWGKGD
jgi:hypothetical protein